MVFGVYIVIAYSYKLEICKSSSLNENRQDHQTLNKTRNMCRGNEKGKSKDHGQVMCAFFRLSFFSASSLKQTENLCMCSDLESLPTFHLQIAAAAQFLCLRQLFEYTRGNDSKCRH